MQPSVIIHSAAERRPDVVETNPKGTQQLNIQATEHICQAASKKSDRNILFIHIFHVFSNLIYIYIRDPLLAVLSVWII